MARLAKQKRWKITDAKSNIHRQFETKKFSTTLSGSCVKPGLVAQIRSCALYTMFTIGIMPIQYYGGVFKKRDIGQG